MMKYLSLTLAIAAASVCVVSAQDLIGQQAHLIGTYPIGTSATFMGRQVTAEYNNTTFLSGYGIMPQGAATVSGNGITKILLDDVQTAFNNTGSVGLIYFSVVNFDPAVAITARPRLRMWNADGAGGGPGTMYPTNAAPLGFTYNPISFAANTISLYYSTFAAGTWAMPTGKIWIGFTYDNNVGGTGATLAQLNELGVATANPVDIGSSQDTMWLSSAAGSFFGTANPVGAQFNYQPNPPVANEWFGMEMLEDQALVTGTVALGDYTLPPTNEYVTVTFTNGTTTVSHGTILDANGGYSVQGPPTGQGSFNVYVKGRHWLNQASGSISEQFGVWDPVSGSPTLFNGDCDGDNEVALGDFGILSNAFGSFDGDANYNINADLDGDGEVGLSDFGILNANFGMLGD